jgi:2,3-bisphosphoglycerate-dependent phosphoglycerate mutase
MTTIYLIRHAQPDFTVHNDMERPLTDEGRRSCQWVASYLQKKQIQRIFSSPYRRAVDTVLPFADESHLDIQTVDDLRERAVDSVWIENFSEFVHRQWSDFEYKLGGGESLREVQDRCVRALEAILAENQDKNIAIGCHGTAISVVLHYYDESYGVEHFNLIRDIMPFAAKLTFENIKCRSIEVIDIRRGGERKLYEKSFKPFVDNELEKE